MEQTEQTAATEHSDWPQLEMQPRQTQACLTEATECLYGGAVYGGKSYLLRAASIHWCGIIKGLQCYLFRRQYPDLMSNHMEGPTSFRVMLADAMNKRQCRIVDSRDIRFWNGSNIFLRHMHHESDLANYQGTEIHFLLMDELTHFQEVMYRFLRHRVRLGNFVVPDQYRFMFPRILCATNPGGVGHHWVKQTWMPAEEFGKRPSASAQFEVWLAPVSEGGMVRQFIPARAEDNPIGMANDPEYMNRLEGLGDPALILAMKEGDWDHVAGAMFTDKWRDNRHIVGQNGKHSFPIPASWDIWRGGDDGYASPLSVHWITRNPDTGTFYLIAELYKAGLLPEHAAAEIQRIDRSIMRDWGDGLVEANDDPLDGEMDSAAFSDTGTGKPSRASTMNERGCNWRPVEKGKDSRVMRVQLTHRLLSPNPNEVNDKAGNPLPGLQVFPNCHNFIRTIKALPVDPHNPEDVDSLAEDHAFDSVTYGLSRRKHVVQRGRVYGI
jgi:hypothetical protein